MLDQPDALIRAGDVFEMLNTDRSLARAIAEHHGLVKDSQAPDRDPIEVARWIGFMLDRGERELIRRRDGEEAIAAHTAKSLSEWRKEPEQPFSERLRFFLKESGEFLEAERSEQVADDD